MPLGDFLKGRYNLEQCFISSFESLFDSSLISFRLDWIHNSISDEGTKTLCDILDLEEIRRTLFRMSKLKALGLDRYMKFFYKSYWEVIGPKVVDMV